GVCCPAAEPELVAGRHPATLDALHAAPAGVEELALGIPQPPGEGVYPHPPPVCAGFLPCFFAGDVLAGHWCSLLPAADNAAEPSNGVGGESQPAWETGLGRHAWERVRAASNRGAAPGRCAHGDHV